MRNLDELLVAKCFRNKKMNRRFGVFADDDINSKEPQFNHFTGTFTNRDIPIGRYNKLCLLDTEYARKVVKEFKDKGIKYKWFTENKRAKLLVFYNDDMQEKSPNSKWITSDRYKNALKFKPPQLDEESFFIIYFQDTLRDMVKDQNIGQNAIVEYQEKNKAELQNQN